MIEILGRKIDNFSEPYVIAELSGNHNGSIERAKASILAAKNSGAHAIKIQTYTPDTMTLNSTNTDFIVSGGLWDGYSLYELYKEAHTPYEWHKDLFSFAKDLGIVIFSSPFDESAVDLLESCNAPAYKIASFELTDFPLLKYVAKTGKPVLISTGLASQEEIDESVNFLRSEGCSQLLLFHCISSYPAPIEQANLKKIITLRERYNLPVGLSDHTIGNTAAIAAVALGACAVEKHFTLSRSEKGPDTEFSMEPHELTDLVNSTRDAWESLGNGQYERSSAEESNRIFRRSLYFSSDLKAGDKVGASDIRRVRPGYGLSPKYYEEIIGKTLKIDVSFGDRVSWDIFENN